MKIVKPSHSILLPEGPLKHIEKIGRICYKSEDAITEKSAESFVRRLFNSKHHAMLEHFRFIMEIDQYDYQCLAVHVNDNKYITLTDYNGRYIMSASARGIHDMYFALHNNYADSIDTIRCIERVVQEIVDHYDCMAMFDTRITCLFPNEEYTGVRIIDEFNELSDYEYRMHGWYSILFTCDRGVTHEMVRHRDASFAQESTRYCNYNKGKYDNEITVIKPCFWEVGSPEYDAWYSGCKHCENVYMALINSGAVPQQARSVLPNSLKAEIVITAQIYEWEHIFDLRVHGTTGAPHPQIREVMTPAYNEMVRNNYLP